MKVTFPADYPFKPMKVDIETKMFHPNIDDKGHMCIPMLVVRDPDAKCASSAPLPCDPDPFPSHRLHGVSYTQEAMPCPLEKR